MNNQPIGILDSGVGGLSVWREIKAQLPNESLIYIADSKNAPYGQRDQEEILRLAKRLITFLIAQEVKLIIIACNTITVSGIDVLRQDYPNMPIIGTVPVIKKAAELTKNGKIGVFSTTRTAASQYQKDLIRKFARNCEVISVGSDDLVPLIENGIIEGDEVRAVVADSLLPLTEKGIDTLAVACTHYPFVENEIRSVVGPGVRLLEPSAAVVRHAKNILEQNQALAEGKEKAYSFYTTGGTETFQEVAKYLLNITIQAKNTSF